MGIDFTAPLQYLFGVGYFLTYLLEMMVLIIIIYFVGKRKLMIEIKPSLDFQESMFPNVKKNYFNEINRVLHVQTIGEKQEGEKEETAEDNETVSENNSEEEADGHLERLFPTTSHANMAIHDAPLWLLSYMTMVVLISIYNVIAFFLSKSGAPTENAPAYERLINFDSLAQSIQNFMQKIVGSLLPSLSGYLLSLLFYTLILSLILILIAKLYFHLLKLNQLQVLGKSSSVYLRIERLWNILGFSHTTRLEHSVSHYLLLPGTLYFVVTLVLDYYVFMDKVQIADLHLALMHLFFLFVPRFFAELFDFPVHFVRKIRREKHKVPWSLLPDWLTEQNALPAESETTGVDWGREEKVVDSVEFPKVRQNLDTPYYKDIFDKLGINDLYRHQYKAWEALHEHKKNLVLAAPFSSGRTTFALLSVLQEAAVNGNTVLYIHPNGNAVSQLYKRFRNILKQSIYFRYLPVFNMNDPGFLSQYWQERFPQVLFADFSSLEKHLLSSWPALDSFLGNLTLVVIDDIEQISGITATNFYFFLKRFVLLRNKQNSRKIHFLLTLPPIYDNYDAFENLFGVNFTFLEIDKFINPNSAEVYAIQELMTENISQELPGHLPGLTGKLMEGGYHPVLFSDTVTDYQLWRGMKENEIPARLQAFYDYFTGHKQVAVLDIRLNNVLRLLRQAKGIGDPYLHPSARFFAVFGVDHFLAFLFKNQLRDKSADKGHFVFSDLNQAIAAKTMLSLLSTVSLDWMELCALFGERLVARLFNLPQIRDRLLTDADHKYYVAQGASETDFHTAQQNTKRVVLVQREEAQELFTIDAVQARSFLYPGKIFTHLGNRLRVPLASYDALDRSDTIQLHPINDLTETKKKSEYELNISFSQNDRLLECRQGRAPLYYFSTRFEVREKIYGYRQWQYGRFWAEYNYSSVLGEAIQNTYVVPGVLLFFHETLFNRINVISEPQDQQEKRKNAGSEKIEMTSQNIVAFSDEEKQKVLLALEYLLLQTMKAYLFVSDDLLEVVIPERLQNLELFQNPQNNSPLKTTEVMVIFDVFPGGCGYSRALTPERLFSFLRVILKFISETSPNLNEVLVLHTRRDTIPVFEETDLENFKIFLTNLLSLEQTTELRQKEREVFKRLNKDILEVKQKTEEQQVLDSLPQRIQKDYELFKLIGEEINKQWPV